MLQKVYVMSDSNGVYKIGVSKTPDKRLKTLQIGNKKKMRLVFTSELLSNAHKIETMIHKRHNLSRIHGEWFRINDLDTLVEEISLIIKEKGECSEPAKRIDKWTFYKETFGDPLQEIKNCMQATLAEKIENERIHSLIQYLKGWEVTGKTDYIDLIKSMPEEKQRDCIRLISSLINYGWGYEQIKEFVTENATKRLES